MLVLSLPFSRRQPSESMEIKKLSEYAKEAFGLCEETNPELNTLISLVIELNDAYVQMLMSNLSWAF